MLINILSGRWILLCHIVWLLALPPQVKALEITWAVNPAPPFHILKPPLKGLGICDVLIERIGLYLPDVSYSIDVMPQKRVGLSFQSDKNLCFPCMIHKPDEEKARYSHPTHIYRSHGVIADAQTASHIFSRYKPPVSLAELLTDEDFLFAYPTGRKMGELQPLIEHALGVEGGVIETGVEGPNKLLQLISVGRLDYSVDYDIVIRYYNLHSGQDLVFIPLRENHSKQVYGAIGCTNNAWGKNIINKINRILPQLLNDPVYIDNLLFWFAPNEPAEYLSLLQQMQQRYGQQKDK